MLKPVQAGSLGVRELARSVPCPDNPSRVYYMDHNLIFVYYDLSDITACQSLVRENRCSTRRICARHRQWPGLLALGEGQGVSRAQRGSLPGLSKSPQYGRYESSSLNGQVAGLLCRQLKTLPVRAAIVASCALHLRRYPRTPVGLFAAAAHRM
jgi:hypothetical protein